MTMSRTGYQQVIVLDAYWVIYSLEKPYASRLIKIGGYECGLKMFVKKGAGSPSPIKYI